jgi:hypothetical protein
MPAGLSVEERGAWLNRCSDLESYIAELRAASAAASDACTVALEAARRHVQLYSGCPLYDQEQATIRTMREQAERLEEQAAYHQIALSNAIGLVNSWLPTAPAPVQAAPEPLATPSGSGSSASTPGGREKPNRAGLNLKRV